MIKLLNDVLTHNARFVKERERPLGQAPAKKIAIFTCMDTRLVEFLEPAMGLRRGDAQVIKNAGTAILDHQGGVIRSLVVAVHGMGCEEIYVIGHLDCGLASIDEDAVEQRMLTSGIPKEAIDALVPSLGHWLGTFKDVYENVRRVAATIRSNQLIPASVPVHGLMFDPETGRLEVLVNGYHSSSNRAASSSTLKGERT